MLGLRSRRKFLEDFASLSVLSVVALPTTSEVFRPEHLASGDAEQVPGTIAKLVDSIPVIATHEHIGSIDSVGFRPKGFRCDTDFGAEPLRPTTVFDLLFDPYLNWFLRGAGLDAAPLLERHKAKSLAELGMKQPEAVLEASLPYFRALRSTTMYYSLRLAFRDLYGFELDHISALNWQVISKQISDRYASGMLRWCRQVFERLNIDRAIKLVELSYLVQAQHPADSEASRIETELFSALARIDGLVMGFDVYPERFRATQETLGFWPQTVDDYQRFLDLVFQKYRQTGCRGIKTWMAYHRDLHFEEVQASELGFSHLSDLTDRPDRIRRFQDFAHHQILLRADAEGMPYQIHTGVVNLTGSGPLRMTNLFSRYRNIRFVLIHCYPFISDCGLIAKQYPNVSLDTSWQVLLGSQVNTLALREWIGLVPHNKIFLSMDSTSVEQFYGSMVLAKQILRRVLAEKIVQGVLTEDQAGDVARALLRENALRLYRL